MSVISRLYDNYSDAARAVSELERAGVPHDDISIVANNTEGWYSEDGRGSRRVDRDADGVDDRVEGASAGAGIGAAGASCIAAGSDSGIAARQERAGKFSGPFRVRTVAGLPRTALR